MYLAILSIRSRSFKKTPYVICCRTGTRNLDGSMYIDLCVFDPGDIDHYFLKGGEEDAKLHEGCITISRIWFCFDWPE